MSHISFSEELLQPRSRFVMSVGHMGYNTLVSYTAVEWLTACIYNRSSSRVLYTLLCNTIDLCKVRNYACIFVFPCSTCRYQWKKHAMSHFLLTKGTISLSSHPPSPHLSSPPPPPPPPTSHQLLRVYMKPLFSTEGVGHLLYSPGQRLLIRDLEAKTDKGQYTVDLL